MANYAKATPRLRAQYHSLRIHPDYTKGIISQQTLAFGVGQSLSLGSHLGRLRDPRQNAELHEQAHAGF